MNNSLVPIIVPATITDYNTVQNMARFYVYDRTGFMRWECPENGMFECIDFKHYFVDNDKKAFLIKVENELAGFILLDKECLLTKEIDWNIGEFFILAKFQSKGVALKVIELIFKMYPGKWSVAVMPENIKALKFWRKAIILAAGNKFTEIFKTEKELKTSDNPDPYAMNIFTFEIVI